MTQEELGDGEDWSTGNGTKLWRSTWGLTTKISAVKGEFVS